MRQDNANVVHLVSLLSKSGPFLGVLDGEVNLAELEGSLEPNEFCRSLGVPPPQPDAVHLVYECAGLSTIQACSLLWERCGASAAANLERARKMRESCHERCHRRHCQDARKRHRPSECRQNEHCCKHHGNGQERNNFALQNHDVKLVNQASRIWLFWSVREVDFR